MTRSEPCVEESYETTTTRYRTKKAVESTITIVDEGEADCHQSFWIARQWRRDRVYAIELSHWYHIVYSESMVSPYPTKNLVSKSTSYQKYEYLLAYSYDVSGRYGTRTVSSRTRLKVRSVPRACRVVVWYMGITRRDATRHTCYSNRVACHAIASNSLSRRAAT